MNIVAVIVLIMGAITLYVGVYHFVIYIKGLRERVNLFFALGCFFLALYDLFCALLYNSSSVYEGHFWQYGQYSALCFVILFMAFFLYFFIGVKPNRIFAKSLIFFYALLVLLIFVLPDKYVLDVTRPDISPVSFGFWGTITYYEAHEGILLDFLNLTGLAFFVFMLGMLLNHYRKFKPRNLFPLLIALSFLFLGSINDVLISLGVYHGLYLLEYTFMGIVIVMTYSLTNNIVGYIRTRKLLEETEAGFRNVVALSPGAMAIVTHDAYEFINPRFEEMFGYPLAEISSKRRWMQMAYPDMTYRKQMEKMWDIETSANDQNQRPSRISMIRNKMKILKYVNLRVFPIGNGRFILLAEDITELKNAENILKRSEERLRNVIDIIPHMIYVKDANDRFLLLNSRTAEAYGMTPADLAGRRQQEIHPDKDEEDVLFKRAVKIKTGEVFHDVSGKERILQTIRTPFAFAGNEQDAVLTVSVDISDLNQAEKEIRKREEDLRVTLNSIGDAVIVTDTEARINIINPVAEKMTGWTLTECKGLRVSDLLRLRNPETEEPVNDPVWKVLSQGTHFALNRKLQLVSRDGFVHDVHESSAPIMDQDDHVIGTVLVFRDVTQEMKVQEQLLQSEKMQTVGQLAGGVAHDFNNMLAGIMGYAELSLQNMGDRSNFELYIRNIIKISERAADLTSKLLSFSRRGKIQSVAVDIHSIIKIVIDILSHTIDRRIEIKKDLLSSFPYVVGDPAQLQNMILNIALNARDAMPVGGTLTMRTTDVKLDYEYFSEKVETAAPGEYILIEIRDTGIGMDKEMLPNIFEPFFTTKGVGKGTGLGLSAVYGSIKEHKGFIDVDSEVGKGSLFKIYLPCAPANVKSNELVVSGASIKGSGSILVVDDEKTVRDICSEMLKNLGYSVMVAEDGVEAVRIFAQAHASLDLVILDMVMPGMNGRDTFIELQKADPAVKVIISTGFNMGMELQNLFDMGLCGLLQKPFVLLQLSSLVHDVLARSIMK